MWQSVSDEGKIIDLCVSDKQPLIICYVKIVKKTCGLKTTQRRILILGILIFVLENEIKKKKYSNENCILNTLFLFFLFVKYIFHLESPEMRFFFLFLFL